MVAGTRKFVEDFSSEPICPMEVRERKNFYLLEVLQIKLTREFNGGKF